jgi:glycogen(starch) synthase
MQDQRDVFVCHASEDKSAIVLPIVEACRLANITTWYDDHELVPGHNIPQKISEELTRSRFLLVVFSSHFLRKNFVKGEVNFWLYRMLSDGRDNIIPVMATDSQEEIKMVHELFPLLSHIKWAKWEGDPHKIVAAVKTAIFPEFASKVTFISSEYPPHIVGGLGVHVKYLTDELSNYMNVDIVLPGVEKKGYISQDSKARLKPLMRVEASYPDLSSWFYFSKAAAEYICRLPAQERPDIIHCHDWVTIMAGIKCKFHLNIPLVFHLHLPNRRTLCAAIENLGLACADLITVNSYSMRKELDYRCSAIQGDIEVVKNGVHTGLYQPAEDWPAEENYILFVGRLVEQKGVEYLLRAFYFVREKFPGIRLKIVGEGGYKEMLTMLARNLTIDSEVDFVGWRNGPALAKLYQKAMVVVVPSIYEPFGMIALEAMACKRPVVVSREGGLQEIITHGDNGFHAEPKDDLDLAQWIMSLLADGNLRAQMGEKGYELIGAKGYTWPTIARQYMKLYEQTKEKPVNRIVSAKAQEYKQQVVDLAKKNIRPLEPFAEFLNTLFK